MPINAPLDDADIPDIRGSDPHDPDLPRAQKIVHGIQALQNWLKKVSTPAAKTARFLRFRHGDTPEEIKDVTARALRTLYRNDSGKYPDAWEIPHNYRREVRETFLFLDNHPINPQEPEENSVSHLLNSARNRISQLIIAIEILKRIQHNRFAKAGLFFHRTLGKLFGPSGPMAQLSGFPKHRRGDSLQDLVNLYSESCDFLKKKNVDIDELSVPQGLENITYEEIKYILVHDQKELAALVGWPTK